MKKNLLVTLMTVAMATTVLGCGEAAQNTALGESVDNDVVVEIEATEEMTTEYGTEMTTEYAEVETESTEIESATGYAIKTLESGETVIIDTNGNAVATVTVSETGETVVTDTNGNKVAAKDLVGYDVKVTEDNNVVLTDDSGEEHKLNEYTEEVVENNTEVESTTEDTKEADAETEATTEVESESKDESERYESQSGATFQEPGVAEEKPYKQREESGYTDGSERFTEDGGYIISGYDHGEFKSEELYEDQLTGGTAGDTITIDDTQYTYTEEGILADDNYDEVNQIEQDSLDQYQESIREDSWEEYLEECPME